MAKKYLDDEGLRYLWTKIKNKYATQEGLDGKVDKEAGKVLSSNDFTDTLKSKLEGIAAGAEVNVQSNWSETDSKSDAFIKNKPSIPTASTTTPKMDGTAAVGSETKWAKGDHVHPSDTSRVPTTRTVNGKALSADVELKSDDIIYSENEGFNVTQELKKRIRANSVQQDGKTIGIDFNVTEDASGSSTATTIYTCDGVDYLMGLARTALDNKVDKVEGKGLSTNDFTDADKTKLDGIREGANVKGSIVTKTSSYPSDAILSLYDATTGEYSDFRVYSTQKTDTMFSGATAILNGKVDKISIGKANGVAPLDANSKIDSQYLPSYVDDVVEAYARSGQTALSATWLATGSASGTVITPETGKIYVLMADSGDYSENTQFRWSGTTYVKLADGGVSSITNAEIDTIVAS